MFESYPYVINVDFFDKTHVYEDYSQKYQKMKTYYNFKGWAFSPRRIRLATEDDVQRLEYIYRLQYEEKVERLKEGLAISKEIRHEND